METKIIETAGNGGNWGKFMVGRFTADERAHRSPVPDAGYPLARWDPRTLLVLDLATGEGALFRPDGSAEHDLNVGHQIWVCPMFEGFLTWLYGQDTSDLQALPGYVDLPNVAFSLSGYRRPGRRSGT